MPEQQPRKGRLLLKQTGRFSFFNSHDRALSHGRRTGHAHSLIRQASLTKEVAGLQDGHYRLLALFGNNRELDLAFVDIENGVGRVALEKDLVVLRILPQRPSFSGLRETPRHRNRACLCASCAVRYIAPRNATLPTAKLYWETLEPMRRLEHSAARCWTLTSSAPKYLNCTPFLEGMRSARKALGVRYIKFRGPTSWPRWWKRFGWRVHRLSITVFLRLVRRAIELS
jgi:hypothetical protein